MKRNYFLLALSIASVQIVSLMAMVPMRRILSNSSVRLYQGMEKGPMNADWFYSGIPPHREANELHQNRKWKEAAREYDRVKDQYLKFYTKDGINGDLYEITREEIQYTKNMARLNLAACLMAQRQPSEHWASFDALLNIPQQKRISQRMIEAGHLEHKIVLVRTDNINIKDVFRFMESAILLKKRTDCYVVLSVPYFIKKNLAGMTTVYNFGLIGENEQQPVTDYETHIVGLLGHLLLFPHQTSPESVILTPSEMAIVRISQMIDPVLARGKRLAVVFTGNEDQTTLIGGKRLPQNSSKYGINIDIRSFFGLLRKYSDLGLVVKNDKNIKEVIEEEVEWYGASVKKYTEDEKIDGIMALASLMNSRENIFAFGVDNDSTNVFIRGLTRQAQRRMSLIVANGSKTTGEYDACMEGEGDVYTHMISNCRGYKCETPEYQAAVIERAYQDMTANKHHVIQ